MEPVKKLRHTIEMNNKYTDTQTKLPIAGQYTFKLTNDRPV